MNWKEYSRLRSIARKRIERAAAAGKTEYVFIPTVKQAKASGNPEQYMNAVKAYLNDVPSLREAKDAASIPSFNIPGDKPVKKPRKPRKPLTEAQRARKREADRRYRARKKVRESAKSEKDATKKVGYLKALETVAEKWREAGLDIGNWIGVMSPKTSQSFVNYMEYRFAQGDYNTRYTIDTFIRDFGELYRAGYNMENIKKDFDKFLAMEKELQKGKRKTNKYGVEKNDFDIAWRKFVMANTGKW